MWTFKQITYEQTNKLMFSLSSKSVEKIPIFSSDFALSEYILLF